MTNVTMRFLVHVFYPYGHRVYSKSPNPTVPTAKREIVGNVLRCISIGLVAKDRPSWCASVDFASNRQATKAFAPLIAVVKEGYNIWLHRHFISRKCRAGASIWFSQNSDAKKIMNQFCRIA